MNYYAFCILNLAILATIYGGLVLIHNWKGKKNQLFFLYCLAGGIWGYFYAAWQMSSTIQAANIFLRIAIVGSVWIPVFHLSFVLSMFDFEFPREKILRPFIYISAIVFSFLCFTPYMISSLEPKLMFPFWPVAGSLYIFFLFYFSALSFIALMVLFQYYRSENKKRKQDAKWLIVATSVMYVSGYFNFPLWYNIPIPPVLNIFISLAFAMYVLIFIRNETEKSNLLFRKCSAFFVVYSILFSFSITSVFPLVSHVNKFQNPFLVVLLIGGLIGLVLSVGPFIYAYLVQDSFWLKGQFSMGLAHELKSPLMNIRGALDLLVLDKSSPYTQMIENNMVRLEVTTNQLLDVASLHHSDVKLEKTRFNLSALILDLAAQYTPSAKMKNLVITTNFDHQMYLEADQEKLNQTVSNLIINAIKYSRDGEVKLSLGKKESQLFFSIVDTGKGISKDHLRKIFDRFYQANKNQKGSGIGLSVAKAWVEAHGGQIWAESEGEGKGTTVTFTLPES